MSCCPTILPINVAFNQIRRMDGLISPTCWDSLVWSTVGDTKWDVLWTLGIQSEWVQEIRKSSNSSMMDTHFNVTQLHETKNDRNNCCHVVTALQRYQLKGVVSPFSNFYFIIQWSSYITGIHCKFQSLSVSNALWHTWISGKYWTSI